jgi:predicted anti-sigma-YlaC factor YlaD
MAHDPYSLMISLSLDGLLNAEEEQDLQQHMRTCDACAQTWRDMSLVEAMFKAQPMAVPGPDFAASVMARVDTYNAQRRWYPWFALLVGVLVVAAIASIAGPILFFSYGLHHALLEVPLIATVIGYALQVAGVALYGIQFAVILLVDWLNLLTTDPIALAVVVAALALASTWIGLLEGMKLSTAAVEAAS